MAPFKDDADQWHRLDWRLLQNSAITLYFSESVLEEDVAWFSGEGYQVASLSARDCVAPEDLLIALADVLSFPDYFGSNLDAFNDCLSDVAVPDAGGLVLVLRDFDRFAPDHRPFAQAILDICAGNSRRFLLTGRRFLVFVQSANPRLAFEPVGSMPVLWNPREWLDSKRGL
jgi:RNAse (barnase) inhibitor barstar